MTSGAPDSGGRFIAVGQGFPGVLPGSRTLRWLMPRMVHGVIALWHQLYLAAIPSHVTSRCGWTSLPFAPSYGMQSLDKGAELPARRYLVPSYHSG
jgi:hypothetical protein